MDRLTYLFVLWFFFACIQETTKWMGVGCVSVGGRGGGGEGGEITNFSLSVS